MRHTPLLLGAEDGMVALAVGDLHAAFAIGAVLLVFGALVENPVWTKLARSLARRGVSSILLEMPGHGLNGHVTTGAGEAVPLARQALACAGVDRFVVITESAGLELAATAAASDVEITEVIVAGLPLPDAAAKLARNVGALDYARTGLRMSTIAGLADAERRKRYLELLRAKVAWSVRGRAGRSRSPEIEGVLADPAIPELAAAIASGTRALILCGRDDRCRRRSQELAEAYASKTAGGPGQLEVDSSFPGRLAGFGSLPAQDWFVSKTLDEVERLVETSSPNSAG
jgi:hypothetical protein